jgi:hypothetical protein
MGLAVAALGLLVMQAPQISGAEKKQHVVALGAVKRVPYSKAGDPAGALADETSLKTRNCLWTGRSRNGPPAMRTT